MRVEKRFSESCVKLESKRLLNVMIQSTVFGKGIKAKNISYKHTRATGVSQGN